MVRLIRSVLLLAACGFAFGQTREVAVKMLNPPAAPVGPVVEQLRKAGVNAVYCRIDNVLTDAAVGRNVKEFRKLLGEAGIRFFITAPVFNDPAAVAKDPELLGYGHLGNPSKEPGVNWLAFACPARPDFRKRKMDTLVAQVREVRPDGLSLDFIRYFIYWERVAPDRTADSIEKFCFCDYCLRLMTTELGFRFPAGASTRQEKAAWVLANHREAWTAWKCEKITSMVRDTAAAARAALPGVKISLHGVPWLEQEYAGGRRVVAGQDLAKLAPYVDVFGPMSYFQMLQRKPEWVHEVVADYFRLGGKPVLPSIQAAGSSRNEPLSVDDFRKALVSATAVPSAGVSIFQWNSIRADAERLAAIQEVLSRK